MTSPLSIEAVHIAYGNHEVIRGVDLQLHSGEIACLLGPSGCGKTTLLRAVAGFEPLRAGRIRLGGSEISRKGWTLPPEQRRLGMVFQDFALFPHLSVADNVGFGIRGWKRAERRQRIQTLLQLVGLEPSAQLHPHQLSGGQQQRIALARALAPKPRLLLMDEPFSSMDVELRECLARQVREILKNEGITAVLVTHDQLEAFAVADRIAVMFNGRVHQWGRASTLYHRPVDHFVANFVGQGVFIPGRLTSTGQLETELGNFNLAGDPDADSNNRFEALIRPDDLVADPQGVAGWVEDKLFRGAEFLYRIRLESGTTLLYLAPGKQDHALGDAVRLRLNADRVTAFPVQRRYAQTSP